MAKRKSNQLFYLWVFVILVNMLVLGPVGWIAKTYHKELKNIKELIDTMEEEGISRAEYSHDQEETGGRLNIMENRLYDIYRILPKSSDPEDD